MLFSTINRVNDSRSDSDSDDQCTIRELLNTGADDIGEYTWGTTGDKRRQGQLLGVLSTDPVDRT